MEDLAVSLGVASSPALPPLKMWVRRLLAGSTVATQ
jgi:hypothetical protein